MPTKAELEEQLEQEQAELEALRAEVEALRADREALEDQIAQKPPLQCINCGQTERQIEHTAEGYRCPSCQHEWTDEHEQAPFRRVARGE